MATWITHLRIAEALLEKIPYLDAHLFAVGNIAPDSGMPDEKWEVFTPPTEITHFSSQKDTPFWAADLDFYCHYLRPLFITSQSAYKDDPRRFSFALGYFCHLVTDNLWHQWIGVPTQEKYQFQFDADRSFIWEVKKDWYGLDLVFVRTHPNSLFWEIFLDCAYEENYLDFLLKEGVQERIRFIQQYYQSTDEHAEERVNRERLYLNEEQMAKFVELAVLFLEKAYNMLNNDLGELSNHQSVLEILSPADESAL